MMEPMETWDAPNRDLEPSPGFEARVMRAVRAEETPPIPFPLPRLLVGLAASAASLGGFLLLPAGGAVALPAFGLLPLLLLLALVGSLTLWIEATA